MVMDLNSIGGPGNIPRPGRPKGSKNRKTLVKQALTIQAAAAATMNLSSTEIDQMMPLDIMLLAMRLAAKQHNWNLSASLAEKVAPYLHAKAVPTPPKDDQQVIEVIGGLPDE